MRRRQDPERFRPPVRPNVRTFASPQSCVGAVTRDMTRVAIIGGGPGGLMTARLLERRFGASCRMTLLEATDRVGGKV